MPLPGVSREAIRRSAYRGYGIGLAHRVNPRGVLVSRSNIVFGPFYGYPAELIADWCGVSVRTAARWKSGISQPSPSAIKLFELHRDRRVLGKEWEGWLVNQATLVDPEGNSTTQGQLRAYAHVYALCRELSRNDEFAKGLLDRIVAMAG